MKSLLTLTNHVAPRCLAAVGAVMLLAVTAAEAKPRRVVHVHADQVIVHRARAVTVLDDGAIVHRAPVVRKRIIDIPTHKRPTKAAMLACQMGPNFIGAAYRGKRYRPYTRSGRPRICVT